MKRRIVIGAERFYRKEDGSSATELRGIGGDLDKAHVSGEDFLWGGWMGLCAQRGLPQLKGIRAAFLG